ncbi:ABC-2 type transport system ATP-binding protein [Pilibacter termitis]|uniref:ABC-2 type transport system ATP-binding protein n=1 Tax=Pilibacter termitis TaxID=263852 RepID=A0A1T4QXB9_9ENTE|nr:ABC transporter ATP-binding protein [Pilibacter termitis]SKA08306.1 ABC-2 type transport system ATP-binding protein [Pilibacter termitis]
MNLEIKNLSKNYSRQSVLSNISFSFESNKIYGVVGPNGVGKSTLFKCITGLIEVNEGKIFLDNHEVTSLKREEIVKNVSYLLSTGMIQHLSGWKNAMLFAKLFDTPEVEIEQLFHEFDLYTAKDKKVKNYSLGMQQRLALIVSLINRKRKVIILDEPYLGLDPLGIKTLNDKLLNLKEKGHLIIVSNHQLHESEKIFDEVIFLTRDGIVSKENTGESLSSIFTEIYVNGGGR